ncbi:FLJ37770-like protein, partial [Trichonephila clavipes]
MINGRTRLHVVANGAMTGQRYIDEVLLPHVRLFRGAVGDKFVFMDDNATCHRTLAVQDCLDFEGIQRLVWSARSPDLNPIENVWDALGRQVAGRKYPPTNKNTLILALTEEWDKLPQQLLDNVVQNVEDDSRPGRPSTSKTDENVEKVTSLIRSDRRLSIRAIAETVNIDKECVRQILHDNLNMQKVCAKMVPKILTFEQQATRKNVCTDILDAIKNDPNLLEKVKSALKGTRFESVEAVKEKMARVLKELTKDDFQHCFRQWKIRMERCRDREGVYIEDD